jgi:hypothetical protein
MQDGFKKFHDCQEATWHAWLQGREPQTYKECIAPVKAIGYVHADENDIVAQKLCVDQMHARDMVPCQVALSPRTKRTYYSHGTFDARCLAWLPRADTLHFSATVDEAWQRWPRRNLGPGGSLNF